MHKQFFFLILMVIIAAGLTIAIAAFVAPGALLSGKFAVITLPLLAALALGWRMISKR